MEIEQDQTVYLNTVDTAKVIRKILKESFPELKFKVRSSIYSGGSSIHVKWINGPSNKQVEEKIKHLESAGFDGSIDLKYYKRHWLLPNGEIIQASSEGSENSGGYRENWESEKPLGAKPCSLGADYIFCDRELTEEVIKECYKTIIKEENIKVNPENLQSSFEFNNEYFNPYQLVWRFTNELDFTNFKELKAIPFYSGSRFGGYEVIRSKPINRKEIKKDIPELIIKGNCIRCNESKAIFNTYCSKCLHEVWRESH